MAYEMLVGLEVIDDASYNKYRKAMTPLLNQQGGGFNYDFKVTELMKSQVDANINRVFTIYFKDEESMNDFFNNSLYLKIKKEHFEKAVKSTTIIAS